MQKRIRLLIAALWTALLFWGIPCMSVCAETSEKGWISKPVQVVGFLVIFTVVCGVTAYFVMRPSLKKLKESRKNINLAEEPKVSEPESEWEE